MRLHKWPCCRVACRHPVAAPYCRTLLMKRDKASLSRSTVTLSRLARSLASSHCFRADPSAMSIRSTSWYMSRFPEVASSLRCKSYVERANPEIEKKKQNNGKRERWVGEKGHPLRWVILCMCAFLFPASLRSLPVRETVRLVWTEHLLSIGGEGGEGGGEGGACIVEMTDPHTGVFPYCIPSYFPPRFFRFISSSFRFSSFRPFLEAAINVRMQPGSMHATRTAVDEYVHLP